MIVQKKDGQLVQMGHGMTRILSLLTGASFKYLPAQTPLGVKKNVWTIEAGQILVILISGKVYAGELSTDILTGHLDSKSQVYFLSGSIVNLTTMKPEQPSMSDFDFRADFLHIPFAEQLERYNRIDTV